MKAHALKDQHGVKYVAGYCLENNDTLGFLWRRGLTESILWFWQIKNDDPEYE